MEDGRSNQNHNHSHNNHSNHNNNNNHNHNRNRNNDGRKQTCIWSCGKQLPSGQALARRVTGSGNSLRYAMSGPTAWR